MPTISKQLFDAINDSQDGKPLRLFCNQRQEDEIPVVGDALNCLVVSSIVNAINCDQLIDHLDYAIGQIQKARHEAFRQVGAVAIQRIGKVSNGPRISWEEMQTLSK
jgi:hypothetical protein